MMAYDATRYDRRSMRNSGVRDIYYGIRGTGTVGPEGWSGHVHTTPDVRYSEPNGKARRLPFYMALEGSRSGRGM